MTTSAPLTIMEMRKAVQNGGSIVSLVEACLRRIERHDEITKAFVFTNFRETRADAERLEAEARKGAIRGPLHGVPIAVKDVIDVRDWPTTSGSRLFRADVATEDAACVAKLREAGAIIIGKTNLHELTVGSHDNPWFGKVVNPLDPTNGTGGTSSGSVAAVRAGFCAAALGTDTGGSNRSTAAATGLVGFKPANGTIDRSGVRPSAPSLDAVGPLASNVGDAWLVYNAMLGLAEADLDEVELSGLRIGLCAGLQSLDVDPVVASAHDAWRQKAMAAGATFAELAFFDAEAVAKAGRAILFHEFAARYRPSIEAHPERVGADVHRFLKIAAEVSETDYREALEYRIGARSDFQRMLATVDVLAAPVAPGLAPRLSDEQTKVGAEFVPYGPAGGRFRLWANFLDVPTLAMPVATASHLSASIQISSLPGRERTLFAVCDALAGLN